ncbi:MarR family winged helix-turn-helix transcriptional regulator [Caldimonas sp. KR1-144]|uniref:MarR family winged helix-turn-helix transcriptional regulator n=1 Tax=Caldimonas sp. KR1-144 TaxID=3400911 RepID=UPI003C0521DE
MRKSVDHVKHVGAGPAAAAPDDVLEAVHAVMHAWRARQYRVLRDGPHDLTHMEGKLLGFFARHPGATQSELAAHSGRDKGQLARLVGSLRERGLLEATVDENDRRAVHLQLTADGAAVHQALQRQGRRLSAAAVAGLSATEREQLVALLGKVLAQLEQVG